MIFAFAARTASVRVGCFFGCGAFNAFPAAGIIGNACVGMTEPRRTGCVVMGPVGADLFLAIRDNALPPGSFDRLAVAHPENPKRKVPSPALWSAGSPLPAKGPVEDGRRECPVCVPSKELFRPWPVIGRSFINQEIKMRRLIVAVCCAALAGSVSVASAQTTGPAAQETVKANDPMNANAKKTKKPKKTKKMAKPDAGMTKDTK